MSSVVFETSKTTIVIQTYPEIVEQVKRSVELLEEVYERTNSKYVRCTAPLSLARKTSKSDSSVMS